MSSNKNEKMDNPAAKENAIEVEKQSPQNGEAESTDKINTLTDKEMQAIVEAILFASEEPLNSARIREVAPELADANINKIVRSLNKTYDKSRPFHIDNVAGGYLMYTRPEYAEYIERLYARRQANRLSAKALETLAIIAYKQPITKNEMEEIRGVNVDGVVKTLLLRNLVTISGTAESIGNPFLYKTTGQFLEYFGLKNLKELPRLKELDEVIEADPDLREQVGEEILKEIVPSTLGFDVAQLRDDFTSSQKANAEEADSNESESADQQEEPEESEEVTSDEAKSADKAKDSTEKPAEKATEKDSHEEKQQPEVAVKVEAKETDIETSEEDKQLPDDGNKDDSAEDAGKQSANSPEKL